MAVSHRFMVHGVLGAGSMWQQQYQNTTVGGPTASMHGVLEASYQMHVQAVVLEHGVGLGGVQHAAQSMRAAQVSGRVQAV